jgi:hypothetical protein
MKMDASYNSHITTTENTSILQTMEHFTLHFLSAIKAVPFCILTFNPLNAKLNRICHLLALSGAHHILHVSRIRVKNRASYL